MSSSQSLADGPAGRALLAVEGGESPRRWLQELVSEPIAAHPDETTLFDGAPAVAFTLAATGQVKNLTVLDGHIATICRRRVDAAHRRIDRGQLPTKGEFDLISGLTGVGVHLLQRQPSGSTRLRDMLTYLVRLTEPRPGGIPGWWADGGPTPDQSEWAGGHGNLGLAHGIAGPLTLLALAMRHGIVVDGHSEAMQRICDWLDHWRCGEPAHCWWPETLTRAEHDRGAIRSDRPYRPSWCYGTPGIARAQQVAGLALNDPQRQRRAHDALLACVTDDEQLAQLTDATLCHGWAGVTYTAWRVGAHDSRVRAAVPRLLDGLTRCLRQRPPSGQGLLTGKAGALLAQHAVTADKPPTTQWDACLLLNE